MPGIKPLTPSRQIAALIREYIQAGLYPARQRMPSLPQMAAAYGTSVAVIRNALKLLIAEGLVAARSGDGHYVLTQDITPQKVPPDLRGVTNDTVRRSGVNITEIARRTGASRWYISRMLTGARPLPPYWSQRIIKAVSDPGDIVETSGP
jgi:DNA-binding GntR family transcriptional regulator